MKTSSSFRPPVVTLLGAGPGDPELLTVGALRAIQAADVLVVDRLVSSSILEERSPGARVIFVGKEPGHHAVPQKMIQEVLVAQARAGRRVVRVKGGDPFVYGRGGEEALALKEAGILFRILPGVSSALAVPAYAGIPVTHRGVARRFTVISGSTAELASVPSEGWRSFSSGAETLVVLMGYANLRRVVHELLSHGASETLPAAAISEGTTAHQRTVIANLVTLESAIDEADLENPMVLVFGDVVRLAPDLHWFDASGALAETLGPQISAEGPLSSPSPKPARVAGEAS